MKSFYLKFTKKTFLTLFVGMSFLLGTQGMMAQKTSAQSGDWASTSTWVGGVVPTTSELVTIAAGHAVTYAPTANATIGSLSIANTGSLTITTSFSRTIGNLTIDSGGTLSSTTGATSIASASTTWVNNGTMTLTTLGLGAATFNNNGTLTTGMGSTSTGTLNNNNGATLNLTGTVAGNINNYGTLNSGGLSGTAATAVINNKSTGVFNFTGSAMTATNLVLNATEAGNTVNYSFAGTQTLKDVNYYNLTISNSGTKTWPQSADRTISGNLTINSGITLRVSSAGVSSATITAGGAGYASVPTIAFSAPTSGATAAGTVILTSGVVTSIVITNPGSGYTSAPTITFSGGTPTTAATATATLATSPTAYKFTVSGTTTNSGTLTFDSFAGTGDKNFATFNNPGTITSTASASFIFATADYSGAAQTVLPGSYTNLTLSGSGTKIIGSAASSTLCTGKLSILASVKANVTYANVGVNMLFLGGSGQNSGTIGFTGSGATTINTTYFATGTGTLNVQKGYSITSTANGGDWNTTTTWVDGVVPASGDDVTIVGTATVNLTLSAAFSVGALNIKQGGTLNVSSSSNATNITFTLGTRSPGSTIAGALLFDGTVFGGKTFGNTTVTATGSVIETNKVSISVTAATAVTNYGTITTNTLAPTAATTNFHNYGTINGGGFSSASQGTFTNYSSGTLNFGGTIAGNINNYGTINATALSNSAPVSKIINYSTGVINFTGQSMSSTTMVLDLTAAGNTVNYSLAGNQTIKPTTYSNLILSGSGLKNVAITTTLTIPVGGTLTVNSGVTLNNSGIVNNLGTITNNGDIVQKSSALGTGSLLSTSSINNVTQQLYLSNNQRGWRLVSNPLSSSTFATLATASGITIGTNFTGEYVSSTNTWTSTDDSATMASQKAYKVFITGLTGESPSYTAGTPSNVTLVNKGTAANTEPSTINTTEGQYYLVANPYTAPVSVASILAASTGLSATVSYYNPINNSTDPKVKFGGYDLPTVSGVSGSDTDVVLPPMGAIFVLATSNGTINVPKSAIFTGTPAQTGTYNHKTAQTNQKL